MNSLIPARLVDIAATQEAAREAFERFMDALADEPLYRSIGTPL